MICQLDLYWKQNSFDFCTVFTQQAPLERNPLKKNFTISSIIGL